MRLKFGSEEWLHILMAVRVAQKVLTKGEMYTPAYNHAVGYRIIGEIMRLVKTNPDAPQIGAALDAAMVLDAINPAPMPQKARRLNAAGFPVDDEEVLTPTSWPPRGAPKDAPPLREKLPDEPFNQIDLKVEPAQVEDDARLKAMETAVNQALTGLTQALGDIDKLTEAHNTLAKTSHERFLAVDEYVFAIEDKIAALQKKKGM